MSQIYSTHNESPPPVYYVQNPPDIKAHINEEATSWSKCLKLLLLLTIAFLIGLIFIAVVACSLIFGTPNAIHRCIGNASYINEKCVCDYGFSGDGKNYCDNCGVSFVQPNVARNSRIVGGIKAIPYSWPSAVLVVFSYKGEIRLPSNNGAGEIVTVRLSSKCGGTLIDRTTVLTAGHCIVDKIRFTYNDEPFTAPVKPTRYYKTLESMYTIYAGVYFESETMIPGQFNNSPMIQRVASDFIRHENYNEATKQNDIALIKLSQPIELSNEIQTACLPDSQLKSPYPPSDKDCWANGWGRLSEDGDQPDELYNVKLKTYNGSMCYRVGYGVPKNWNAQMCAGAFEGGRDSCQGDSGGSLFVQDEINNETRFISAGIVSYGDGCALKNKPGIYTRTSFYVDWIKAHS